MIRSRSLPFVLAAALAVLASTGAHAAPSVETDPSPQTQPPVALVGGRIHTADAQTGVIENGVILMRGDTIAQVGGPSLRNRLPADAKIVDISGKLVTPGLIAADTALGLVEIDAESSTVDDHRTDEHPIRAGYDPSSAINAFSSLIPVQAIDGITSAAVAPDGGLLSGQVSFIDLVYGDQAKIVAATNVAIDGRVGHTHGDSRAATLTKLRQTLRDAQFYRRNKRAFNRGQSRRLAASPTDLAALDPVLSGRIPLTISAHRVSDIIGLLAIAKDYGIRLVIVGGAQAWQVADQLAAAQVPVVVTPSLNLPYGFDRLGARMDNAAILAAAGVPVVIGQPGVSHNARNLTHEAGIAMAHGLSFDSALAAVTVNVARAYGMDSRYGSIGTGKAANLVIWDDDPFELENWPTQVWIHGRPIPMSSRQTRLRDRYLDRLGLR
ncbi:MAG: amidohydrolase family protein [Myxococcales bacterium FL481]|nr:MAG: amidohydrolase family protein [Myxococcales bacterium FL481]